MNIPKSKLHDTLTVTPRAGNGAYGPVYGAEYTVNAYVEAGFKRVVNSAGQEVVASLFAICPPDFAGNVGDRDSRSDCWTPQKAQSPLTC